MSMFSFPKDMTTNEMMKSMTAMTDWTKTADLQVPPLMVYPLGAAAAATAVGIGMAGQMTGLMMGAMQAAMQNQRLLLGAHPDLSWIVPVLAEDLPPKEPEIEDAAADPVERAVSAKLVAVNADPQPRAPKAKAARPAKAAPSREPAEKPADVAASVSDGAVAVVEKLKSDAEVAAAVAGEPASKPATSAPAARMEPEDFRRPAEIERPQTPDDLKLISGIGPKLEQVLNGLGVFTFAQIAAWQPEEVAWVDDYLQFSGRIDRDDWIAQAGALAKGGSTA